MVKNYWKHIDDFFREKLGRYRETPPPDVWEALDKQLDGLIPAPGGASTPRPSFRWLGHVAMVSLVAVLTVPLVKKMIGAKVPAGNVATIEVPTAVKAMHPVVALQNTGENEQSVTVERTGTNSGNSSPVQESRLIADANATQSAGIAAHAKTPKTKASDFKNQRKEVRTAEKKSQASAANTTKKTTKEDNKEQPAAKTNEYNSSAPKAGNTTAIDEKETAATIKPTQPAPKTEKKESPKKTAAKKAEVTPPTASFNRLGAGLKAGYEFGTNNDAAKKYTVSPYLQYNLSRKLSILVQPTAKYAQLKTASIGSSKSYYKQNADGFTKLDSSMLTGAVGGTQTFTNYYTYSETHDSIVKSYKKGGDFLEFEIPILLKYKLTKSLSAYGGVNFLYHKVGLTDQTYTKQGVGRSVDFTTSTIGMPTTIPTGRGIDYANSGAPFADYQAPVSKGVVNVGYMLGLSYEYSNKWLFDALMEQSPAKQDVQNGYNINTPVSVPYFRLSVGYKFTR